ncbi:MAG: tripartite tricarboxylate transporter substrate binding protein, partial [Burkholderiales bacterium]
MFNRRKFGIAARAAATWLVVASAHSPLAQAQPAGEYPQQTIKLVVPFSAGSGTDAVAR